MTVTGVIGFMAEVMTVRHLRSDEPEAELTVVSDDLEDATDSAKEVSKTPDAPEDKCRTVGLRLYCVLLLGLFICNMLVFIVASMWTGGKGILKMEDEEYAQIQEHVYIICRSHNEYTNNPCTNATQSEFVAEARSSYHLLMACGVVSSSYLLIGFISAAYCSSQSTDTLNRAEALVARHAKAYLDDLSAASLRAQRTKRLHGKDKLYRDNVTVHV